MCVCVRERDLVVRGDNFENHYSDKNEKMEKIYAMLIIYRRCSVILMMQNFEKKLLIHISNFFDKIQLNRLVLND